MLLHMMMNQNLHCNCDMFCTSENCVVTAGEMIAIAHLIHNHRKLRLMAQRYFLYSGGPEMDLSRNAGYTATSRRL